jgi:hypothetical protein
LFERRRTRHYFSRKLPRAMPPAHGIAQRGPQKMAGSVDVEHEVEIDAEHRIEIGAATWDTDQRSVRDR